MVRKDRQEITAIILCVLLSFLMWLYVMGENNPLQSRTITDIPVALTNMDNIAQSNLAIEPNQKFTANITVSGRAKEVFNLTPTNFIIEADMSGYLKKGENNIPVEVKNAPNGIKILNKTGYIYVKVKLDSLIEKSVAVNVSSTGSPRDGYSALSPTTKPTEVLVSGGSAFVNSVSNAVGQIDISNSSADVSGSIPLKAVDKDGKMVSNVNIETKFIDVIVPIKSSKIIPIVLKTTGKIDDKYFLKDTKIRNDKITIIGDRKNIDKIKQIETMPYDVSKLLSNYTGSVPLNIPSGITILNDIKSVNVDFIVENKIQKSIPVTISFTGQKDGLNYQMLPLTVNVVINGAESIINSIDVSTITAVVDVKNNVEGTAPLPVKVTIPDNVTLVSQDAQNVQVTITKK